MPKTISDAPDAPFRSAVLDWRMDSDAMTARVMEVMPTWRSRGALIPEPTFALLCRVLEEYAEHKLDCPAHPLDERNTVCTCGFDGVLLQLYASRATPTGQAPSSEGGT